MFPHFKKLNNESGIILFIVLMTAIIIMIFSVGILSQSVNETNYAQQQIDQISCDELKKGVFWTNYSAGMGALAGVNLNPSGRAYQVTITTGATTGPITSYQVVCSYDTLQ